MGFNDMTADPETVYVFPKYPGGKKKVKRPKIKKPCLDCGSIFQANGNSVRCQDCRYINSALEKKGLEKVMSLFCQGCKKSVFGIPKVTTENDNGSVCYYCKSCYKQAILKD